VNLIQRVQDILLKPKDTWPVIEQEKSDTAALYSGYIAILAAIPALCGFVHNSIIGGGFLGFSYRVPIVSGLFHMVINYVLSLVLVFVLALITDALAPTFGGTKNQGNALKLAAYAMTASWIGGAFVLLGMGLGALLGLLGAIYAFYLFYLGIPVLMKAPADKAVGYTAVVVVVGIIASIVIGAISALALPAGAMGFGRFGGVDAGAGGGSVSIRTPDGEVNINAGKVADAAKQIEAVQAAGEGAAIPAADLKALMPESLGELKRESIESQGGIGSGLPGSIVHAVYAGPEQRVNLTYSDLGGLGGIAAMTWASMTIDRETQDRVEKVYKDGARSVHEEYHKDGSMGEYTVILGNTVIVEAKADRMDQAALKKVVQGLDLGKIEALKRTKP